MTTKTFLQPSQYAAIARQNLILARFYGQEVEKARDKMKVDPAQSEHLSTHIRVCGALAREARKTAKDALKNHEVVIGTFFMHSLRPTPLKYRLNGKTFDTWPEYYAVFRKGASKGTDIWR